MLQEIKNAIKEIYEDLDQLNYDISGCEDYEDINDIDFKVLHEAIKRINLKLENIIKED